MVDNIISFIHLLAAVTWVGGSIYILFILQPALGLIEPRESGKLQGIIAKRFSLTAWTCIVILLITGFLRTPKSMLFDTSSDIGRMLVLKHLLIVFAIIIGLTIALYVVPTMRRNSPKPGESTFGGFHQRSKETQRPGMDQSPIRIAHFAERVNVAVGKSSKRPWPDID